MYEPIRNSLLIMLVTLTVIAIIANVWAGRPIDDRVILALIAAIVAVYKFIPSRNK